MTSTASEVRQLDAGVAAVITAGTCSGCGACTLLDPALDMQLDPQGFARPVRSGRPAAPRPGAGATFDAICPGRIVRAGTPAGARRHPTLGPVVRAWEAWAADPTIRHRGSSGGALTALVAWLTESGQVSSFTGARAEPSRPQRTVPVTITSRAEALAAAGSRYGPVAALAGPDALQPGTGLVGKPCEITAARALLDRSPAPTGVEPGTTEEPLLLSFFCAGTPSQDATDSLITELGVPAGTELSDMWYRGRGWPGHFTAETTTGQRVSTTYEKSWGQYLGAALQWRCKICPDGVGESADISAADFWTSDENGYPVFAEGEGSSAVLARTRRGEEVLNRAFDAGVLVGQPLVLDELAAVQPLQVDRRTTLLGRLVGARLAGRRTPRYVGFGLVRLALSQWHRSILVARGSYQRVRRSRSVQAPG